VSYTIFNEKPEDYDKWYIKNRPILFSEVETIKKTMGDLGAAAVKVEIGVGTGMIAFHVGINFGIDPAIKALYLAKSKGIDVIQALGENLPLRDNSVDLILLTTTLCFLEKPGDVFKEIIRCLRENGHLLLCFIPKDSLWGKAYEEKARKGHKFYSHARFYSLGEVKELLSKYGFRIIEAYGTLSFDPSEKPKYEPPTSNIQGKGFVCFKATI